MANEMFAQKLVEANNKEIITNLHWGWSRRVAYIWITTELYMLSKQNGHQFTEDILKYISLKTNFVLI